MMMTAHNYLPGRRQEAPGRSEPPCILDGGTAHRTVPRLVLQGAERRERGLHRWIL